MAGDSADVELQLAWEARWRGRAAIGAGVGAVLMLAASVITVLVTNKAPTVGLIQALAGTPTHPGPLRGVANPPVSPRAAELAYINSHALGEIAAGVVWAVAAAGIAFALFYLVSATQARRPALPPLIRPMAIAGPIGAGVMGATGLGGIVEAGPAFQIAAAIKAHSFVHGSDHSHRAVVSARGGVLTVILVLSLVTTLALAISWLFLCLNAMRVGLLTRFLGIVGIFGGVLYLLPFTPLPILQIFWLGGAAVLFAGRWPSGTPPAWQTGQAEPWPSQQQLREERDAARREREGLPPPEPKPPAPVPAGADGESSLSPAAHPSSKKRKRKRRR